MADLLLVLLGVLLLTAGGEALIRGAMAAAQKMGVSALLSGLLIVGFGTSAPELVVSVDAALAGKPDIAVGNVVGSNIGNILLILGLCALITPLAVKPLVLRRDALAMVVATVLLLALAWDGELALVDAVVLMVALAAYLVWAYVTEREQNSPSAQLHQQESQELTVLPRSPWWVAAFVGLGLVLLIAGSQVLLMGAVGIAQSLNVSEAVIGLTLVAVGTSLPELSISVIAAIRRHADVAIGNVLGSNIFNALGILGVSSMLQPLPWHQRVAEFDQWVMLLTALLLLWLLLTGRGLSRVEGAMLLVCYGGYLVFSFAVYGG